MRYKPIGTWATGVDVTPVDTDMEMVRKVA